MYGRRGYFYHLHLAEARGQRQRLAITTTAANKDNIEVISRKRLNASLVVFCLTVATLGMLLAASVVVRIAAI